MIIQHNIMALNSYRQLNANNLALARNLEKLSSGYRINRAGDDAAGLAISEKMRAQVKGLETAQKNALDGISLIQTAEGALTEIHAMLNRMVELAGQAANGIYDDQIDRKALDDEFQQLKAEIDRITKATNFNGKNLLDGSLAVTNKGISLSSDINDRKILDLDLKAFRVAATRAEYYIDTATPGNLPTFTGIDGLSDIYKFFGISADDYDVFEAATYVSGDPGNAANVRYGAASTGDFIIVAKNTGVDGGRDNILIKGNGDAYEQLVGAEAYWDASIKVGENATDHTLIGKTLTVNGKTYIFTGQLDSGGTAVHPSGSKIVDGDKVMGEDHEGNIAIDLSGMPPAGDQRAYIATQIANAIAMAEASDAAWNPDGSYAGALIAATLTNTAVNAHDPAINTNKISTYIDPAATDTVGFTSKYFLGPATNADSIGGLKLQIGDTGDPYNIITVSVEDMSSKGLGLANMNIASYEAAVAAVGTIAQQGSPGTIKGAINMVSSQRGALGALQNRLEHTINNIGVTAENVTAAESRIRDTDMAYEMMLYTKNSILVQAAQAMLAQANMVPQGVLQLLR